jgi:CHAT domain-containing protein
MHHVRRVFLLRCLWLAVVALVAAAGPVSSAGLKQAPDADEPTLAHGSQFSLDDTAQRVLSRNRALLQMRGMNPNKLPSTLTAAQLQAAVQPGEALLVYLQLEDRLLLHVLVAGSAARRYDSALDAETLRAMTRRWRQAITGRFDAAARAPVSRAATAMRVPAGSAATSPSTPAEAMLAAGQSLASALVPGDLLRQLTLSAVKHLTLVPTGDLATLPWAALPVGAGPELLIDRFSIAIAPGLAAFAQASADGDVVPVEPYRVKEAFRFQVESAVVAGNPAYPSGQAVSYPDLPGAALEAKQVASLFKVTALLGPLATKANLLAALPAERVLDVLYLATHAVSSSERPLDDSYIVLAGQVDDAATRWTAREIQQTPLRFNLAVLSACQTGLGQQHDAGVIGVARAFYLAGVPQTVMSLWNVDDAATLALMSRFAQALSRPEPFAFFPAEALRQAMLQTRKTHPDPAHWASFTTFGVPNVLWP